jgi:hypothetical protein
MKVVVFLFIHQSEKTLRSVLLSLSSQNQKDFDLVILADNVNSETKIILEDQGFLKFLNLPNIIIHNESFGGKYYSHLYGLKNHPADIYIWCDDDNYFSVDYVENIKSLFLQNDKLGSLGPGIIIPVDIYFKPLSNKYKYFFQWKNHDESFLLGGPRNGYKYMPAGTGMSFSKKVAERYLELCNLGEITAHDRIGKKMISGNDTQIVYIADRLNLDIGRSGDLKLFHITTNEKLKHRYILKMYFSVYSCHLSHAEANENIKKAYLSKIPKSLFSIFMNHFLQHKHRSLRLGKIKYLVIDLGERKGILDVQNKRDWFLEFIVRIVGIA